MNGMGVHQSARALSDEWLTPPDLLEALQDLVDFFDPNSQVGYMATQKCIDKAKKAIEKALGEWNDN